MKKSQPFSVSPYFDGSNYSYWKVHVRAFLKSLAERVWVLVDKGWYEPTTKHRFVV
jgi:hypothetical protein